MIFLPLDDWIVLRTSVPAIVDSPVEGFSATQINILSLKQQQQTFTTYIMYYKTFKVRHIHDRPVYTWDLI